MNTLTPATYDVLRDRTITLMRAMERPPIVGISGHGGAGKSTLAARLLKDVGGRPEQVVSTDRFYSDQAGQDSGMFELHDWSLLLDFVTGLRATQTPDRLSYRGRMFDGVECVVDLPMPPVVVIEGIRLLRPETVPLLDLAVWIDLSADVAGRRAVERNRAQGDSVEELELWRTKWIPEAHQYEQAVRPQQLAHLILEPAGPLLAQNRPPAAAHLPDSA